MNYRRLGRIYIFLFTFLAVLVLGIRSASGAESGKLGIFPTDFKEDEPKTRSWFVYSLKPNEEASSSVTIQNKGAESVKLKIYSVDASSNKDGAFTLFSQGVKNDVGGWLTLDSDQVEVPADSKITVPFTLKIPFSATPGDHVGGIAIEPKEELNLSTSGVKVIQRLGVRFYITVEGERLENLAIKNIKVIESGGQTYLSYSLANTGNINLSPKGSLKIGSVFGSSVLEMGNLGEVLAGKEIEGKYKVEGAKVLPFVVTLDLNYGKAGSVSKSAFFDPTVPVLIFGPIIILFIVILFFLFRKKK